MASMTGHSGCVEQLLLLSDCQEGINNVDSQGRTALLLAAKGGHTECVKFCLKYAASLSHPDTSLMTALHYAASGGHIDCVKLLLQNNPDLEARDNAGHTPLILGAFTNRHAVCIEILDKGALIDSADICGKTALMHASESGSDECVDLLLRRGANRELKDMNSLTASDLAQQSAHYGIVKKLKEAPAVALWSITDKESESEQREPAPEDMVSKFDLEDEAAGTVSSSLRSGSEAPSLPPASSLYSCSERDHSTAVQSKSSESTMDQMKDLEEENELLNQDLNKLRQEYATVFDKLSRYEEAGVKPSPRQAVEPIVDSNNDEVVEKLCKEISSLKSELRLAQRDKETLKDKVDTLQVQLTSFMPEESEEAVDTDEEMDFQEGEDFDLPGRHTCA
jgi:ankyrin repeat protein